MADVRLSDISGVLSRNDFGMLFGGCIQTDDKNTKNDKPEYIGVWGKDKIKLFKKELNARGIKYELVDIDGANRQVRITSQDYRTQLG